MYTNWKLTYCHIWCSSGKGLCPWPSYWGASMPCHQGLHFFAKDASPWSLLHVCVVELIFPSIGLSCNRKVTLCSLLAFLMNWMFPLCAGDFLDWCPCSLMSQLVSHWVGVSACWCDWVLSAHHLMWLGMLIPSFPFAVRVMQMCHWVLPVPLHCMLCTDWWNTVCNTGATALACPLNRIHLCNVYKLKTQSYLVFLW